MPATKTKPTEESRAFADDALTPFSIEFTVRGVRRFFFNAPNIEAFIASDERRKAGVKRPQKDDPEEKVWRQDGALAVPGREFVKAIGEISRAFPDPTKSGAKSMRPIIPTALSAHEEYSPFFHRNGKGDIPVTEWDAVSEMLVRFQTKMGPCRRPILYPGWTTKVSIDCVWPEVFSPSDIATLMNRAGQRGIGDAIKIGEGRFVVVEVNEPREIAWT